MKKTILILGAVLMTVAASAFELGKQDANIYYNRINTRPALEMCMNDCVVTNINTNVTRVTNDITWLCIT